MEYYSSMSTLSIPSIWESMLSGDGECCRDSRLCTLIAAMRAVASSALVQLCTERGIRLVVL
jgi:hypothetical protein